MTQQVILVIDDEVETIELIQAALQRRGYDVIGSTNGHDGLQQAHELRPAIVLIDLMLPGLNGFEICRLLRDDPITRHIPRVVLSARNSSVDQVEALAAGADRYLVKPVGMKVLVELVQALIDQHDPGGQPS